MNRFEENGRKEGCKWGTGAVVFAILMSVSLPVSAADTNDMADLWLGDTSDADKASLISFSTNDPGSVTVVFSAQTAPPFSYLAATMIADAGIADSPFSGDYTAVGAASVSFRAMGSGIIPRSASVVLIGNTSGRKWRNPNVVVSGVAGEWITNDVSFDLSAGWVTQETGDLEAMWQEDLRDVGLIGVRFSQRGGSGQSYTVEEFRLVGTEGFITPPATLSPLEQALLDRFGVKSIDLLTDDQKVQDLDGDGMTDLNEILSENDPNFANSIFKAEIVSTSQTDGITIKWPCVAGATYTVCRSQDLTSGFHALDGAANLLAAETGYMTYNDTGATGVGPYFYKVVRVGD
jgi:hypothetical protein